MMEGEGRMTKMNEEMKDVLVELGISPRQVLGLGGRQRSRMLNFLLRWECIETLHDCLDALIPANPTLVSLLDLRAKAFLAQGRPDDARAVMEERLERKTSLTARALLARVHLARGDGEAAHQIARTLVEEREDSPVAWALLGEVALARGKTQAALDAYRRLSELRPQGRAYLLGMMSLYRASDDWVTASGYAVQLLRSADDEKPLPASYLHRLRDYFQASGEETRRPSWRAVTPTNWPSFEQPFSLFLRPALPPPASRSRRTTVHRPPTSRLRRATVRRSPPSTRCSSPRMSARLSPTPPGGSLASRRSCPASWKPSPASCVARTC
jgi:tetratricopeptide (TPR) repeat protein